MLAGRTDIVAEHRVLREFVFLESFRQQFRQFLKAYDLPTELCDEDSRWHEFLTHYAGVIEDGSLSCTAKGTSLKLVQDCFYKGKANNGMGGIDHAFQPFMDNRFA